MPEMNGYDATVQIRRLENEFGLTENEKHFICGFSAHVDEAIENRCIQSGMNVIISKPISKVTLEEMLKENKRASNLIGAETDFRDLTILP